MALDITATLAGLGGLIGGVADVSIATDPLTVEAGVTLNGGLPSLLTGALNPALGIGVQATLADAHVTNLGTVQGTTGAGISLGAGGTASNGAGGAVAGTTAGIAVSGTLPGAASTVNNAGAVTATGANGVGVAVDLGALTNGGTIAALGAGGIGATVGTGSATNGAGGSIAGALDGLDATGSAALINAGTILGNAGNGVGLAAGTLTNEIGGAITGALSGVTLAAKGTVSNAGTIAATGANGIGVNLLDGGVVIDSGTISGSDAAGAPGGVAVNLGGTGGSRLVLDPGAALNGVARAAGTGNVLEIAAGAGTTALKDIGTTVTGFGTTAVDAGAALDVAGGIVSPGTVSLGDGASLTVGGPVAAGVSVDLGGVGATLKIGDIADFKGTISNLGADDTLDLTGLGIGTTVSYAPGTGLTVTTSTGASTLIPVALPIGVSLGLTPDGLGVTVGAGGLGTTVTVGGGAPGGGTGGGTGGGGTAGGTAGGGTTTMTTDPTTGDTTVTTTGPLGVTTSQVLPAGSSIARGAGTAVGDVVSIDPSASYDGKGQFTVTGHVASASGVTSVSISAVVDGAAPTVLGTATVAADGSYSFADRVGAHLQGFITATETDGAGAATSVQAPYSLQGGLAGSGKVAQEVLFNADGTSIIGTTNFHRDRSSTVDVGASGHSFEAHFFDTFNNHGAPDNTFVFNQNHGLDVINQFRPDGTDHDTISLPSADFANLAAVLGATHDVAGGTLITDPTTGDTIKLAGVSKAELKANPSDFTFHA